MSEIIMDELSVECTFCEQFCARTNKGVLGHVAGATVDREIYSDEHFTVVPALGQLVEGWLLIIPRTHTPAIANVAPQHRKSFRNLVRRVTAVVSLNYREPFLFEHGSASGMERSGACIEHAHLHIVPADLDIRGALRDLVVLNEEVRGLDSLWDEELLASYVYYERSGHTPLRGTPSRSLPCQLLRRIVAQHVRKPVFWDWRRDITPFTVLAVARKLRGQL